MNAAIERHVQTCHICQREGLAHLATQKRAAVRLSRKGPSRRDRTRPLRLLALVLTVALLVLLVLVAASRGTRLLPWLGSGARPVPTRSPVATATATATPVTLTAALTFGSGSSGSATVALSPDGKWVAMSGMHGGVASVTIWDAKSGTQAHILPYAYASPAASLAWSADGTRLAAANGTDVVVWTVAQSAQLWALVLPPAPAMRVYDVQAGDIVQRLDPATAFGQHASLQWGSDGQLAQPAKGAGLRSAAAIDGPQVSVWQVAGSHIYASDGNVYVGTSAADMSAHGAFLTWSPDGRYLLWATMSRPLVVAPSGTPVATAPPTATPATGSSATQAPNVAAQRIAARVASVKQGDALIWFSPDGHWVAICDRTSHGDPLVIQAADATKAVAVVPGGCGGMTVGAVAWRPDATGIIVAMPDAAVATFALPPQ